MPKVLVSVTLIIIALAFIPPALIAAVRAKPSPNRPIDLIQDMEIQPKPKTQQPSDVFADGRASRPRMETTVARGDNVDNDHLYLGRVDGEWVETFPPDIDVDMDLLRYGRQRYEIYCGVCHGDAGYGDGVIHQRANQLMQLGTAGTSWIQPRSLHEQEVVDQPVGQIYHTIAFGIRNMAGYAAQVPVEDRWAIAAYVKALQRSQRADMDDVPPDRRDDLVPMRIDDVTAGDGQTQQQGEPSDEQQDAPDGAQQGDES